jgi:PAS domain-containing protein
VDPSRPATAVAASATVRMGRHRLAVRFPCLLRKGPSLDRSLFEALLDSAPVGAALFSTDGRYLWVNEALAVMNERSRGDHVGCSLADVLPAAVAEAAAGIIDEVVATRRDRRFEGTFAFDGRPDPRTFTQTWYPVQSGGAVTAVAALVWEITDERSVQAEIAAAGQRFELALSAGGMGTWEWDLRTGVVRWTSAAPSCSGSPRRSSAGGSRTSEPSCIPTTRRRSPPRSGRSSGRAVSSGATSGSCAPTVRCAGSPHGDG